MVYERDGKYQLYARQIILDGVGLLYERFEKLKRELSDMGMFASEYKKPIPKYIKERIHNELSPFLNEDKIINYIHRFCLRHIKRNEKGNIGKIRFLSSPTPLGFHTHYDTIFEMAENIVNKK